MTKRNKLNINATLNDIEREVKYLHSTLDEYATKPDIDTNDYIELRRILTFLKNINNHE